MFLLDLIIKSAVIGIIVFTAGKVLFSRDSEWKLFLWKSFFSIVVVLPLLLFVVPQIKVPLVVQLKSFEQEENTPRVLASNEFLSEYRLSSNNRIIRIGVDSPESGDSNASGFNPLREPLFLFWLTGFLAVLTWLAIGHYMINGPGNKGHLIKEGNIVGITDQLRSEMKISKSVNLYISNTASVPFTSGIIKPFIFLPQNFMDLPESGKSLSLRHELEHIRRGDNLWNILVNLCCSLFWFNPLIWVFANWYRIFREKSVDEKIVKSGVAAADYAHLLVNVAAQVNRQPGFIVNAVLISKVSSLKDRIISILYTDKNEKSCKPANKAGILVILIAAAVFVAALTPVDFAVRSEKVSHVFQTEMAKFSQRDVKGIFSQFAAIDDHLDELSLERLKDLSRQYPFLREIRYALIVSLLKSGKNREAQAEAAIVDLLSKDNYSAKKRLASIYAYADKTKIALHWLYLACAQEPEAIEDVYRWRSFRNIRKNRNLGKLEKAAERGTIAELFDNFVIEDLLESSRQASLPAANNCPIEILATIAASDPDHNHRELALELLGGLGSDLAYSAIENAVTSEIDTDIIETAFECINYLPDEIINPRIDQTSQLFENPWAVTFSSKLLAKVDPQKAATNLLNVLLLKTDQECQKYAIHFLSLIPVHGQIALKEVAEHHPSDSMKSRARRYLKTDGDH